MHNLNDTNAQNHERSLRREREDTINITRGIIIAVGVSLAVWAGVTLGVYQICHVILKALE